MIIKSWKIPKIQGSSLFLPFRFAKTPLLSKSAENTRHELESYLLNKPVRIYVDTCSLLHEQSIELLDAVELIFAKHYQILYVFNSVFNEIQTVKKREPKVRSIAKVVERRLFEMQSKGIVHFIQGDNAAFSDVNFISKMVSDILHTNVLLISQDNQLTELVLSLKSVLWPCIKSEYRIYTAKLTKNGLSDVSKLQFFKPTQNIDVGYDI